MKRRSLPRWLLTAALLILPLLWLTNLLGGSVPVARGKITAVPLTDQLSESQRMAQQAALADGRVLALTEGRRTEVFSVVDLRGQHTPASTVCATETCYQVDIYNFDENGAIMAIVHGESREVLDVLHLPGGQPGINKRLADLALHIALNDPEVVDILGYKPLKADLAPVPADLVGSTCDGGHLCAAPTFRVGDKLLWAVVDLTAENMAGLAWTDLGEEQETTAPPFVPTNCTTPGTVTREGWIVNYAATASDGLRVYDVSFNGTSVAKNIKLLEWHASYGASGYRDSLGCGGGGGFQIFPYGDTQVLDLLDEDDAVIGFEVMQDFRMSSWGGWCNYRYDQRIQFYNDGRFRVVSGAYGKGCGNNSTYYPVVRIDLDVVETGQQSFATWNGLAWQTHATEFWDLQASPYTPSQAKWRITHASGQGYYMEPGQSQFGDGGRGDNAYIYVTQHKPAEGDSEMLVTIGQCCNNDHRQGPEAYINGESIANQNLVVWYVPKLVTDITPDKEYCWTITGEPNPETYPCFGGPMFIPKAYNSFTNPALVGLGETAVFSSTAAGVLPISYAWNFGDGMGTSTDPNPSYQFDGYGTYTVTLTTTGANGESATSTQTVAVAQLPTAVINPFDAVLVNEPITLSHSSTGTAPLTVTWNLGDGTISTAESPVHSYATAGEYTIILTATNELGEDSTTAVLQVVEPPTAVIDPAGPAVVQQPITLSHSSAGTAPLAVAWAWGDGATSTDETPSHSYAATGHYTVTLTVSNSWGLDTAEWLLAVGDASAVGTPGEGGQVIGEGITLTLPPGGTAQELTMLYTVTDLQADWPDYVSAGHSFNWAAFVDGVHLTPYSFAAPIAVALDAEAAGLDPASLLLLYWDGSAWMDAAETCENNPVRMATAAQLATEICATGDFALVGRVLVSSGTTQYLPLIIR